MHLLWGTALQTTKGYAAPDSGTGVCPCPGTVAAGRRAAAGLAGVDRSPRGLYQVRGDFHTARALGEQAVALAPRVADPDLMAYAHYALGHTLFSLGDFAAARSHFEHGVASAMLRQHRAALLASVILPEVNNRALLAASLGYWAMWTRP